MTNTNTNTVAVANTSNNTDNISSFLRAAMAYDCYQTNMATIKANNRQNKFLREEYQKSRTTAAAPLINDLLDGNLTSSQLEEMAKKANCKKLMARFVINGGKTVDNLKDKVNSAQNVLKSLNYRIASDENKKLSKDKQIDILIQALNKAGIALPDGIK